MYFILTHGWGVDPDQLISIEYHDYKKARSALDFLFDIYQEELERTTRPQTFVCILKTKGVRHNGKNENVDTKQSKKDQKNK